MDKLLIGLIGVGIVLLAVGIAISISSLIVIGVVFLAAGILLALYRY